MEVGALTKPSIRGNARVEVCSAWTRRMERRNRHQLGERGGEWVGGSMGATASVWVGRCMWGLFWNLDTIRGRFLSFSVLRHVHGVQVVVEGVKMW
mgnify:CR=1 FL=1